MLDSILRPKGIEVIKQVIISNQELVVEAIRRGGRGVAIVLLENGYSFYGDFIKWLTVARTAVDAGVITPQEVMEVVNRRESVTARVHPKKADAYRREARNALGLPEPD